MKVLLFLITVMCCGDMVAAESGIPALTMTTNENGTQEYSVTLQILFLMSALTILPAFVIMMTSFLLVKYVCLTEKLVWVARRLTVPTLTSVLLT